MTSTLSYYIANTLKLYNEDGTERTVKQQEIDFMKMVAKAWEMQCDLKLIKFRDRCIWILESKNNIMQTAIPILNRILVKPDNAAEKIGDFVIPDDAQKKPKRGTVMSVGPGKYADETGVLIPMQCKIGDVILYSKFGGTEIEIEGDTLVVLKEDECLLIL